jgi:hypothetical protein
VDSRREFLVSADLWHDSLSLAELEQHLGSLGGESSHSIGDPKLFNRTWPRSVWRVSSGLPSETALGKHLEKLREMAEGRGLFEAGRAPDGTKKILNIGVIFSTAYCTVELSADHMSPFLNAGFALSVVTYPLTSDDDAPTEPDKELLSTPSS